MIDNAWDKDENGTRYCKYSEMTGRSVLEIWRILIDFAEVRKSFKAVILRKRSRLACKPRFLDIYFVTYLP